MQEVFMLKIEKSEYVSFTVDDGIDFKNRRIYFGALIESYDEAGSSFTWRSVERAIRGIHVLETIDAKKPIEIHMSSVGGDCVEMIRLYDVIQASPCQIKFFGGGCIASSATYIMSGCDERYLYTNTRVLVHDGPPGDESFIPSKAVDHEIAADETKFLQDMLNKNFAQNSRMPIEFWDEFVKRDLWLSAEETIILGLADKIIEPKKRGNLRKVRLSALKNPNNAKELPKLLETIKMRTKSNNSIVLNLQVPTEQFDKNIVVDNTPENIEIVEKISENIEKPKDSVC
jgi:ATP-dependent protease ClpP protease subunit